MDYYRQKRVERLQKYIGEQGLDAMLITSKDAVFYLSGASYDPVERPFIIILRPEGVPSLVVPRLEYEHMMKVEGFGEIHWYFEYPSIDGQNWYDYVNKDIGKGAVIGIEPSMPSVYRECLKAKKTVIVDYIDTMRLVKDASEINAIRLACKWTDYGMKMLHEGLYRGESVIEATMHARNIQTGVVKTTDFNYMTSSFLTAAWPAPKSAQPHVRARHVEPALQGALAHLRLEPLAEAQQKLHVEEPSQAEAVAEDGVGQLPREDLGAALGVPHLRAKDTPDDELREASREAAPRCPPDVGAKMRPARADHGLGLRRLVENPHETRHLAERRREIGVPESGEVGVRVRADMPHSRAHGFGLAHIGRQIYRMERRMEVDQMGKDLRGGVRGPVVHEAERHPRPSLHSLHERGLIQAPRLVSARHHHGKRLHRPGAPSPQGPW